MTECDPALPAEAVLEEPLVVEPDALGVDRVDLAIGQDLDQVCLGLVVDLLGLDGLAEEVPARFERRCRLQERDLARAVGGDDQIDDPGVEDVGEDPPPELDRDVAGPAAVVADRLARTAGPERDDLGVEDDGPARHAVHDDGALVQ